jgi:DNA modification methylase
MTTTQHEWPPPGVKWYYADDAVCIAHGDCREIVPSLGRVDLVLTDPPYGIAMKSNGQIFKAADAIDGDLDVELAEWTVRTFADVPLAMFYSPFRPVGEWRSVLVWAKGGHVGGGGDMETCWKRSHECIGVARNKPLNGPRDESVLRFNAVSPPPSGHFCEKPLPLMAYLVSKLTAVGDTILDPFAGSCTTGRAAKDLHRKAILIEREERYCEIGAKRMAQAVLPFGT